MSWTPTTYSVITKKRINYVYEYVYFCLWSGSFAEGVGDGWVRGAKSDFIYSSQTPQRVLIGVNLSFKRMRAKFYINIQVSRLLSNTFRRAVVCNKKIMKTVLLSTCLLTDMLFVYAMILRASLWCGNSQLTSWGIPQFT